MKDSYPGISQSITDWKVQDISDFQEELLQKAGGRISEKWFYTHMKSEQEALPRVDVLNLLSRYAGYANWDDFRFRNNDGLQPAEIPVKKANRIFIIVPVLLVILSVLLYFSFRLFSTREYRFYFTDEFTREPVAGSELQVTFLPGDESPVNIPCDTSGYFTLKTGRSLVRFIVQDPYYRTDTITRVLDKFNRTEQVRLRPNDHALMIRYFSGMNVTDWKNRRDQLDRVIADEAVIWQVFDKAQAGMAVYSKSEFIDLVTMPSGSLKNIEVLETRIKDDRIQLLRFTIRKEMQR